MSWLSDVFQKGGPFFLLNTVFLGGRDRPHRRARDSTSSAAVTSTPRRSSSSCASCCRRTTSTAPRSCATRPPAPVARVAKAGLNGWHRGEAAVAQAMEETMTDTLPEVKTRIGALWSLANIVTLIGLLGTITGLIHTFASIGNANPADRQKQLADGISEAMYNTAFASRSR